MPGILSRDIFISYRRDDAAPYARLLQKEVSERFLDRHLFMDLDSIEPGLDFAKVIRDSLDSSALLLALIGPQWATLKGKRGSRRLDDPDDFVRFEIRTALKRGVQVIPVLVGGARPPDPRDLPADLRQLAHLHAFEWSDTRYRQDADRLLDLIQRALDVVRGKAEVPVLELRARSAEQAGDVMAARDLYGELAQERERALGPEHPDTLAARSNHARLTGAAGDETGAHEQFRALLPAYKRVLGPGHPDTLVVRYGEAYWLRMEGDFYGAVEAYRELLNAAEDALGHDDQFVVEVRGELNYLHMLNRDSRNHPERYPPEVWKRSMRHRPRPPFHWQ